MCLLFDFSDYIIHSHFGKIRKYVKLKNIKITHSAWVYMKMRRKYKTYKKLSIPNLCVYVYTVCVCLCTKLCMCCFAV